MLVGGMLRSLAVTSDFVPILGMVESEGGSSEVRYDTRTQVRVGREGVHPKMLVGGPRPVEITFLDIPSLDLSSFSPSTSPSFQIITYHPHIFSSLTHLTLAEPPETWTDPLIALLSLPLSFTGTLKYLTLSRKENSNVDNDEAFLWCVGTVLGMSDAAGDLVGLGERDVESVEGSVVSSSASSDVEGMDVDSPSPSSSPSSSSLSPFVSRRKRARTITRTRTELRFLNLLQITIRIFPGYGQYTHDESADIWTLSRELALKDASRNGRNGRNGRVVVEKGYWGRWVEKWDRGREARSCF